MTIKELPKIIKTQRLELRQLEPVLENAQLIFDALRNENSQDYFFNPVVTPDILPKSAEEMLEQMNREEKYSANGIIYYIFLDGELIGYKRFYFFDDETKTLQSSAVWLKKSARGHGYAKEVMDLVEDISFNQLGANRITRQCSVENTSSASSIKNSGYHLDGIARQACVNLDGTLYDNMLWSKLKSEYK
ncbi:MAG: GNAT family N-acetyltransferase [Rickettsiales bacterium]|nr:GNAT family N-acetyltransferase [Rickettsiales bacterium]